MRRGSAAGFTLVEAMVTVAIVGLLAGITAPALLSELPRMRASGAARQVLADLRLTRTLAVEKGHNAYLSFDAGGTYTIFVDQNGNDHLDTGEEKKTVDIDAPQGGFKGAAFGSAHSAGDDIGPAAPATAVFFRPNGSAVSAGSSVYVNTGSDPSRHRRVRLVAATGNLRVETWSGTAWE